MSRRRGTVLVVAALAALGTLVLPGRATPADAGTAQQSAAAVAAGATTKTRTVTREFLDSTGAATRVDTRDVSMNVSQTTNLRGRQEVTVSWSGAHPTGGLVGDVNSGSGVNEEYPFVLLQCRGVDSTSVALAKRIRPETCWTQTAQERFRSDNNTGYPAWRSDEFATTAERGELVNGASPRPKLCGRAAFAERWVPMVGANGNVYPGGSVGCAGQAPEASNVGGSGIPSNTTYGITGKEGKGSTQFSVWTAEENATLGCSSSVPCALVAVPVMGVSCDAWGTKLPAADRPDPDTAAQADADCRAADVFTPGQIAVTGTRPNEATSGALWWAGSNWRNRITVPLTFAQAPNVCAVVSTTKPLPIYGSSLMNEVTAQWQPKFCTDKALTPFVHVQTADTSARNLLNVGNIDAAFTSRAPDGGYTKPTVQAPVAVTGFAIGYLIDDAEGDRYRQLRLTPRLLAKLLTESYPGNALMRNSYTALAQNPMNITQDPEFKELNPGLPEYANTEAASTLQTLSSEADLVYALTSYINADPEARAWLDGTPDPWGMKVNPSYKNLALPTYSWPLLDNTLAPQSYIDAGTNPCYSYSPSPFLALIANPTAFVSNIVLNMQYGLSAVNTACPNGDPLDVSTLRLTTQGRQQPGFRFVLGVVPLSAVDRYSLTAAALQAGPGGSGGSTGTTGARARDVAISARSYVSGTDVALRNAAGLFKADVAAKTWSVDYDVLRGSAGAAAYPGTVPVFADVPTQGLPSATAKRLATFLRYAAGPGQQRGLANGQLPPGYLALTKANGLGDLAGYTLRAAKAVAAQRGFVPFLDPKDDPVAAKPDQAPAAGGGNLPAVAPDAAAPVGAPVGGTPVAGPAPVTTTAFKTVGQHSALAGAGLPVLIALTLVLGLAGLLLRWHGPLRSASARVAAAGASAAGRTVRGSGTRRSR